MAEAQHAAMFSFADVRAMWWHFGKRRLLILVLLLYVAVLVILKCLDLSRPSQRGGADSREMTENSTSKSTCLYWLTGLQEDLRYVAKYWHLMKTLYHCSSLHRLSSVNSLNPENRHFGSNLNLHTKFRNTDIFVQPHVGLVIIIYLHQLPI